MRLKVSSFYGYRKRLLSGVRTASTSIASVEFWRPLRRPTEGEVLRPFATDLTPVPDSVAV